MALASARNPITHGVMPNPRQVPSRKSALYKGFETRHQTMMTIDVMTKVEIPGEPERRGKGVN